MSFIKANENFIRIKLGSEMKDLTESDKLEKYELIKEKCRSRISNYYDEILDDNANDKMFFGVPGASESGLYHLFVFMPSPMPIRNAQINARHLVIIN